MRQELEVQSLQPLASSTISLKSSSSENPSFNIHIHNAFSNVIPPPNLWVCPFFLSGEALFSAPNHLILLSLHQSNLIMAFKELVQICIVSYSIGTIVYIWVCGNKRKHVMRMPDERIIKEAMRYKLAGCRNLVKPRTRW